MKRMCVFMLTLIMAVSLCACGRKNNPKPSTVIPSTDMTILPDTMPTIGTNIPDPSVDTQMLIYTEGTDTTADTLPTDSAKSRTGMMH